MGVEAIITISIVVICALPLLVLGIVQCNSKEPVGFWSGAEPPKPEQISNIGAYNRGHGIMWILYGTGMVLSFCTGLLFGGAVAAVAVIAEVFGGIFLMIAWHNRLNQKYSRR